MLVGTFPSSSRTELGSHYREERPKQWTRFPGPRFPSRRAEVGMETTLGSNPLSEGFRWKKFLWSTHINEEVGQIHTLILKAMSHKENQNWCSLHFRAFIPRSHTMGQHILNTITISRGTQEYLPLGDLSLSRFKELTFSAMIHWFTLLFLSLNSTPLCISSCPRLCRSLNLFSPSF